MTKSAAETITEAAKGSGVVRFEFADSEHVTTKQFLLDTINERDRKYEQRFAALDKLIGDANLAIKEALAAALASTSTALEKATANTQAALQTANDNIKAALAAVDQRINQLAVAQEAFARKTEITQAIESMDKATQKAEASFEKRFDEVNSLKMQFEKFALESEVNVKFVSITDKVDTLKETMLRNMGENTGEKKGVSQVGTVMIGIAVSVAAVASVVGVIFEIFHR